MKWAIAAVAAASLSGCAHIPPYADRFEQNYGPTARPSEAALNGQLEVLRSAPLPPPLPMTPDQLRSAIVEALSIAPLLASLDSRRPRARTVSSTRREGYVESELIIEDAVLGNVHLLLLKPPRTGMHAAIVGLHGHEESNRTSVIHGLAVELARAGYVVLLPDFPALRGGDHALSMALLRRGRTLMGLYVYETLLAIRYLRSLPEAAGAPIGLLAHSGGSSMANLVMRIDPDLAALAGDYEVDYRNRLGWLGLVHCETVPALFPFSTTINDDSTLADHRLLLGYGYGSAADREAVFRFFSSRLLAPGPAGEAMARKQAE